MNPIERSVAKSEKAMDANRRLESLHRNAGPSGPPSMRSFIGGLKHGETVDLLDPQSNGKIQVSYHDRESLGDDNKPVRGATTGEYTVQYPNGKTTVHAHGPHANTPGAAKKGANPNAKGWAAGQAHDAVVSHLSKQRLFNDKRVPMPAAETSHPARPGDDPGYNQNCKDCGGKITWTGPNHSDWNHV